MVSGVLLRVWAISELKAVGVTMEQFFIPARPERYTDRGPYRLMKHPAYVGTFLFLSGAGLAALGWGGVTLALPAWPFFALRIYQENQCR